MGEAIKFGRGALTIAYTPLAYIESNGVQYINTAFKANQNTRVVLDVEGFSSSSDPNTAIFGGGTSSGSSDMFRFIVTSGKVYRLYYSSYTKDFSASVDYTKRIIVDVNKNTATLNGEVSVSTSTTSFTGTYPLYLFACNNAGSVVMGTACKMYSCQIYDNGALVRNYVPAKDKSGKIGLWDKVEKKFYGNAGSGSFTTGATISFSIRGTAYVAGEGMSWSEWCNSSYNTDGYYVSGNYVNSGGNIAYLVAFPDGTTVSPAESIVEGQAYDWTL